MPRACVILAMMLLGAVVGAQASAQAGGSQATFYDILKADPSHKLIMRAVDSDPAGKLKALLQQQVPITAFVPTDSAFIKMAMKMRSVKNIDSGSVMKNHCLIAAILKQHMLPGVFDTTQLLEAAGNRPSMLVTKKLVPNTKGQVSVSWPLKITKGAGGDVHIASAAQIPEPGNPSRKIAATTGTLVAPLNVRASNGMLHNINGLLLPMTDISRLMKMTNCPKT